MRTRWLLPVLLLTACGEGAAEDPCAEVDCSLHGDCVVRDDRAACSCDDGYVSRGIICELDRCGALDCGHGECAQDADAAWCLCDAGWRGELCDACAFGYHSDNDACLPDAPCDDDPCIHGVCRVENDAEVCDCDTGYAGLHCGACATGFHAEGLACVPDEGNACFPNPCTVAPNRGRCVVQGASYVCLCDDGWYEDATGACVEDVGNVCTPNPCTVEPNRGQCQPDGSGGYDCDCDPGYHDESGSCVVDVVTPCDPNPCDEPSRSLCTDDGGGAFHCACDAGFSESSGYCAPDCDGDAATCAFAHRSVGTLVSSNGFGVVGYDVASRKVDTFLEHVYRNWDADVHTRDFAFDTYLGVRTASSNLWLNELEPVHLEYLDQSGIIHSVHVVDGLAIHTYLWAPFSLSRPALVLVGEVVNETASEQSVSLYSLHNFHLGFTDAGDPVNPDASQEQITFDAASGAYFEAGPGGGLLHQPIGPSDHHGCTPDNPYLQLQSGLDLTDNADSGLGTDRVAGFQRDLTLAPGASGNLGVVTALGANTDQATLTAEVAAAFAGLDGLGAVSASLDAWESWRNEPPLGLSPAEVWVYRHSEAFLRQGQVRETSDLSYGQIVASLPPGMWNICWMRDMAYAIVALVRAGHFAEARAALEFVLLADSGTYEAGYVGVPYQVTITRYFGRGKEESDANADGPNIEFDGFGLFLWTLGEYVRASGDTTLLDDHWPTIRDEIAGALVALVDGPTGLISADSSIWEVHWNGQQKRYSYTSLAAARGLCEAASLATDRGEAVLATTYQTTGLSIRDAIDTHLRDGNQALASSYEELQAGSGYRDMASIEGLNWQLFEPTGTTGLATLDAFENDLRVAHGYGFFRNDDGGWYDSQEWVFVDLRAAIGNRLAGRTAVADALIEWITAQAVNNHGMIAELHHPDNADYEGELPMIGFGAGGYILALFAREEPGTMTPACGSWEP